MNVLSASICSLVSLGALLAPAELHAQEALRPFEPLILAGEFSKAQAAMRRHIAGHPDMAPLARLELEFEIERLERIRKDFTKTPSQVLASIRLFLPGAGAEDLRRWERERSLEAMVIDGEKRYFAHAAANLFRIDDAARERKRAADAARPAGVPPAYIREEDTRRIVAAAGALCRSLVKPRRLRMTYTLNVETGAVPPGEIVRAWLPYPREDCARQTGIELLWSEPREHLIPSDRQTAHRAIYLERTAPPSGPTVFRYACEYTSHAQHVSIDPSQVQPYDTTSPLVRKHTAERPPHITFHPQFRSIVEELVGDETNPYLKARKIFQWVDAWTPWAGAREYSTMRDIPMYCYANKHGDCGMQTLFFMTMARIAGLPVRWQSGWWLAPGQVTLHDWCEIYLEPYGWLLVDQSFGLQDDSDERARWFYLGSTDAWRWIINSDYSRPFYPAKIHPRSETVDFQRGEVEWRGGNLYFDRWNYHLDIEVLE